MYSQVLRRLGLGRVYTCKFDNQVTNEKLGRKYFRVVNVMQHSL